MCHDGDMAGRLQPKDEVIQPPGQLMVRRFEQQVPGIIESEGPTVAQSDVKIGGDMHVCAGEKANRDACSGNFFVQSRDGLPSLRLRAPCKLA